jgi:hypothetical protein
MEFGVHESATVLNFQFLLFFAVFIATSILF